MPPIPESVAMVSAALLWAIIPAFVARPAVLKVCEFRPSLFATYIALAACLRPAASARNM